MEENKPTMIETANAAAEKLKAENDRMEANIKKLEELKAFELLGGKSEGAKQEVKKEEISALEYSKLALSGKIPIKQ